MKDTGAWLENKFQSWLKNIRCYSYKPSDFRSFSFLIVNFPQIRNRIPKVPCDRMVVYQGQSYYFELKHINGKSLPFENIRDHQMAGLLKHKHRGGGQSYFIIGFKNNKRVKIYAVDIDIVAKYRRNAKRKSIPIKYCDEFGRLIKNKKDLKDIFDYG